MDEFHRIKRLPPYVFEQVNRAAARNAGADIIDLGMGNPDLPAPMSSKSSRIRSASRAPTVIRRRRVSRACAAQAAYYARRFGVNSARRARSSPRSAPRKASPMWRRSPRRATSCWCPIRAT